MTNIYKAFINELVIYNFPSSELIKFIESNNEDDGIHILLDNIDWFIKNNHFDLLKPLYEQNLDLIKYNKWYAFRCAAFNDNLDILKYLHSIMDISDGLKACDWFAVRNANTEIKQWFKTIFPDIMK